MYAREKCGMRKKQTEKFVGEKKPVYNSELNNVKDKDFQRNL